MSSKMVNRVCRTFVWTCVCVIHLRALIFCQQQQQYPLPYGQNAPGSQWASNYGQGLGQQQRFDPNFYQYAQNPQSQYQGAYGPNYQWPQGPITYRPANAPPVFPNVKQDTSGYRQDVHVETELGSIIGKIVYLFDGPHVPYHSRPAVATQMVGVQLNVSAFLGIPYAQAPIGDRRFKPPERYGALRSYSATEYKASCPQPLFYQSYEKGIVVSENCLYLNIFTPSLVSPLLPVMIYIHGGEFEHGSGNLFPGHMMAASQQVVIVTFNYRLGALGFLSTGDEASPGNYGMLDQAMVIRWVHDHIAHFRGDRSRITLFGPGAGAASAGLHLVSPRTRDYVLRVIAQSGSALADWAAITDLERARNTSIIFAKRIGCPGESSWKRVECLKHRSEKDLSNSDIKPELGFFPWAPVVDKHINMNEDDRFLPESPRTLFTSRFFNPYRQYMSGVTRDEAAHLLLKDFTLAQRNYVVDPQYFNQRVRDYIRQYNYTLNADGVYQAIMYMYTNWADPSSGRRIREEYINMMSDALFKAPNDDIVKLMVERQVTTYMYVLNTTVEGLRRFDWAAVDHDTEFFFLSGAPFMENKFFPSDTLKALASTGWTEGDRKMSEFFMTTFANFAKQGLPTPAKVLGIDWKPMVKIPERILSYLNVNTTLNSTMEREYRQLECAFWSNYMPLLIGPPPSTTISPLNEIKELEIGFYSAISAACLFFVLLFVTCCLYCKAATSPTDKEYQNSDIARVKDEEEKLKTTVQ